MRFGGVFVMMNSEKMQHDRRRAERPRPATPSWVSGHAAIQPMMPPALASCSLCTDGDGLPLATAQIAETLDSSRMPPMPMRVLSCTVDGCRNSQAANSSMMTGSAKATRPNRPPNVQASRATETDAVGREPLDDGAGDSEHQQEERHAVAALVLLERLLAEHAERAACEVREAEPRLGEHALLRLRLGRDARQLLGGRGLASASSAAKCCFRGRASSTWCSLPWVHGTREGWRCRVNSPGGSRYAGRRTRAIVCTRIVASENSGRTEGPAL